MNKAGRKRKTAASKTDLPAKRPAKILASLAVLRKCASSIKNAAELDLMALPATDFAARVRTVTVDANCKRQLDSVLGVKRRVVSALAISDVVIDVFQFLRRRDLDTLQIVSRRFNAIVKTKVLTLVCLRMLISAKILWRSVDNQFVLIMDEVGAKELTLLPTGIDDEAAATTLFLNACQSSRVGSVELYGTTPMDVDFFDALMLRAPTIFLKKFYTAERTLSNGIADDNVLRMLQSFAELKTVEIWTGEDSNLDNCLVRTCFKAGVSLATQRRFSQIEFDDACDVAVIEDAMLEFSFGACDEQYATRKRNLLVEVNTLDNGFLQRWIEKAEAQDCRHKLTLDVIIWQDPPQNIVALRAYKHSGNEEKVLFESVNGRHWTAAYTTQTYGNGRERIIFKINSAEGSDGEESEIGEDFDEENSDSDF
ncbi:hypothetical protein AAVH_25834 [Aphelenchoides avenae]|nr:hypothetical protein AAVH_25834 [Aphelenchus avenae]